jgi:hypothetical protein
VCVCVCVLKGVGEMPNVLLDALNFHHKWGWMHKYTAPFTLQLSVSLPLTHTHSRLSGCGFSHFCLEREPVSEGIFVVERDTSVVQVFYLAVVLAANT